MGLLESLKQTKESYNPKEDSISTNSSLSTGAYPVRIQKVQAGQTSWGQDQISIVLEVVSGPSKERLEFINLSFDEKLPEFVLDKNSRILLKLADLGGIEFTTKNLKDEYSASEKLSEAVGTQFMMNLKISPNKNNPEYPYRNYEFEELGGVDSNLTNDIDDDDLPF